VRLNWCAMDIGDIGLRFLEYCKNIHHDNTATVKLVDINPHMLGEGEKRFQTTPYAHSKYFFFRVVVSATDSVLNNNSKPSQFPGSKCWTSWWYSRWISRCLHNCLWYP
jgi:hypothetical protein